MSTRKELQKARRAPFKALQEYMAELTKPRPSMMLVADLGAGTEGTEPLGYYEEPIVLRRWPERWDDEAEAIRMARARQGQGVVVAIDGVPL